MLKKLFIVYLKFNFYCVFCIFACSTVRLAVAVSGEGANIKMNKLAQGKSGLAYAKASHSFSVLQARTRLRTRFLPYRSPYLVGEVDF